MKLFIGVIVSFLILGVLYTQVMAEELTNFRDFRPHCESIENTEYEYESFVTKILKGLKDSTSRSDFDDVGLTSTLENYFPEAVLTSKKNLGVVLITSPTKNILTIVYYLKAGVSNVCFTNEINTSYVHKILKEHTIR